MMKYKYMKQGMTEKQAEKHVSYLIESTQKAHKASTIAEDEQVKAKSFKDSFEELARKKR